MCLNINEDNNKRDEWNKELIPIEMKWIVFENKSYVLKHKYSSRIFVFHQCTYVVTKGNIHK